MLIYLAQIGQPLIIRRISDGERLLSEMLEMFNQPLSWWAARYLFLYDCINVDFLVLVQYSHHPVTPQV